MKTVVLFMALAAALMVSGCVDNGTLDASPLNNEAFNDP
jgi:hypothetical protein